MIVMVVAVNVLFWRPLVAWSEKFRYETTEASETQRSVVLDVLRAIRGRAARRRPRRGWRTRSAARCGSSAATTRRDRAARAAGASATSCSALRSAALVAFGAYEGLHYIATAPGVGLGRSRTASCSGAARSPASSCCSSFATLVWVPVGVWIGMSPRVARLAQPIVQVLASFPANFLFPFATLAFIHSASASTSAGSC